MQVLRFVHQLVTHRFWLFGIVIAVTWGAMYGIAAIGVSSIAMSVIGFFSLLYPPAKRDVLSQRDLLAVSGAFCVCLLSGLISSDLAYWGSRLNIATAFLYVPFAIASFGPDRKTVVQCIALFVAVVTISAALETVEYIANFEEYNELYKVGKTMPVPVIHIRYSTYMALGSICCVGLLMDGAVTRKWEKTLTAAAGLFLVVFVHLLSVRTGLVALYGGVATVTAVFLARTRQWKAGLAVFAMMIAAAVLAATFIPSIKNKIAYVRYDLQTFTKDVSSNYSDNLRIISMTHGARLLLQHPLFGVGIGDIRDEMAEQYALHTPDVPEEMRYTPLSQYVHWLVAYGFVGTAMIIAFLTYALWRRWERSYLLPALYATVAFSLIGAANFRAADSLVLILLLLCLAISYSGAQKTDQKSVPILK